MKPESKDPLARFKARWDAFYQGLGEVQRRRLWVGLGAAFMLGGLILLVAGRTQWSVLYSGLQARDAGAITDKLKADKVPYRLGDGGATIEVPAGDVYQQRLSLATQGLPEGQDKGYELLDGNNLLVSEAAERTNRLRALQGELERTILTINGIEGVRVHLVVPDRELFSQASEPSSASVLLKLSPGFQLDDAQAEALALLVSHAVEGLSPANVVLVDTDGNNLAPGLGGGTAGEGRRSDASRTVERHLHDQIQSLLDDAIGPGQAVVRVHAELDFDAQTVTKDLYEGPGPKGSGLVREESSDSSNEGRPAEGGPAGVVSTNGLGPVASSVGAAERSSSSATRRVVYELDHTVENITQDPGDVKRVSVAVLLKRSFSPAELDTLSQAVRQTAGLDAARGDVLSLAVAPILASKPKPMAASDVAELRHEAQVQRRLMLLQAVAPWALMLLAVLLLTLLAWKALRLIFTLPAAAPMARPGDPPPTAAQTFPAADGDLLQLVERNPSSAAQVLRRMMNN